MDPFLKMDIFFVVSTAVAIIVGGLAAVVLWKVLSLIKVLQSLAEKAEREATALTTDIAEVRSAFKREGLRLAGLFELMIRGASHLFSRKKKKGS